MNRLFERGSNSRGFPLEDGALEDLQSLVQAAAESMHLQRMKLQADSPEVDVEDVATAAVAD
ncbi:hypothetical protein [Methylotetracoccus oryzae]|uniref:hypothetical protein n=1 Tax=Methylotetracoccus oryzae TaxID=1919059 RepID=UPI00111A71DD|nr:hypothetical protein [Methylotetracoccus oryzae]